MQRDHFRRRDKDQAARDAREALMRRRSKPISGAKAGARPVRVLFLNTRDSLGADIAVHLPLARALDREQSRVWAATSTYEAPGESARAELESIPELTVLPLDLGRPLTGQHGAARVLAQLRNYAALPPRAHLQ